jgi:hypothetical protein
VGRVIEQRLIVDLGAQQRAMRGPGGLDLFAHRTRETEDASVHEYHPTNGAPIDRRYSRADRSCRKTPQ